MWRLLTVRLAISLSAMFTLLFFGALLAGQQIASIATRDEAIRLARVEMCQLISRFPQARAQAADCGARAARGPKAAEKRAFAQATVPLARGKGRVNVAAETPAQQLREIVAQRVQVSYLVRQVQAGDDGCLVGLDPRVYILLGANGRVEGQRGIVVPRPVASQIELRVPAGALCPGNAAPALTAYGVSARIGADTLIIARAVTNQAGAYRRAMWIAAAAVALAALLSILVASLFNRILLSHIAEIGSVLDRIVDTRFEIRLSEATVAPELASLAARVNRLVGRLAEMTGEMSRLSLHLAHDLRTPLLVAQGKLAVLAGQLAPENSAAVLEARDQLVAAHRRCTQILEIVRVGSDDPIAAEDLDLAEEVEHIVEDIYHDEAAARDCRIVLDLCPAPVLGQRDLVQRMIANILQNAVKFAYRRSNISVIVRRMKANVLMRVHNDGRPVPAERLVSLFEPNVASSTNEGGGFGLGLPFVRAVARRHGGDAQVLPDARGFLIEVVLPAAPGK